MTASASATPARDTDVEVIPIDAGWELASAPPDEGAEAAPPTDADWRPAQVPGTVAGALGWEAFSTAGPMRDLDAEDWWFRTRFEATAAGDGESVHLRLDGIATVSEVVLNGQLILSGDSMFAAHRIDVGAHLTGDNELLIRCRALGPLLTQRRKPRARWRTRVTAGNLRFFRTMILGRAPGFAPGPAAVGPWRPISLERSRSTVVGIPRLRTRLAGADGVLTVSVPVDAALTDITVRLDGASGAHERALTLGDGIATGELTVPDVALWWPHTHGAPNLHEVQLLIGERVIDAGRVGFRSIAPGEAPGHHVGEDGIDLHVNGRRVFTRGAVWTPVDALGLAPSTDDLHVALEQARDAGMNMLRIVGLGSYESPAFHDLCDELGLMVWQDFMFANLDYPIADEHFRESVTREAESVLAEIAGRPSLTVLCGNSEIEQQVAMLGLDPELGRGELFGELLPALADESGADAIYVPSAPFGTDRPFRPDRGIANYYGVGGYRRPLEDARRAGVRFASECLAFANVPVESTVAEVMPEAPGELVAHHPRWKAAVPRDAGTGWDFEDVRDHYLELLFGVDPVTLRGQDHDRYLELSRAVTGEVMAEVFGEWRRAGSASGGGLILWLRDLMPGAGWGVVDSEGEPKVALHHLRRALAPVAVWTTDEGMSGIGVHVANDRPEPLRASLRVALFRNSELRVEEATEMVELAPGQTIERDLETLIGHFVDASWAYRFGPPTQDLIVVSLERDGELLSQAVRFPAGRPAAIETATALGIEARATEGEGEAISLTVASRRLAYGVRIHVDGYSASDDAFSVEPGGERTVSLRPRDGVAGFTGATLTALNLDGTVRATLPEDA